MTLPILTTSPPCKTVATQSKVFEYQTNSCLKTRERRKPKFHSSMKAAIYSSPDKCFTCCQQKESYLSIPKKEMKNTGDSRKLKLCIIS